MPFLDLQKRFGIDADQSMLLLSGKQINQQAAVCHAFEKELVECSHGIGAIRAERECKLEYEDFMECLHRSKTLERLKNIREQMQKLEKEGKYKAPDFNDEKNRP